MALVICVECGSDEDLSAKDLPDGRKQITCGDCGAEWLRGEIKAANKPVDTFESLRRRFPSQEKVDPVVLARVEELKRTFLETNPDTSPDVAPYWARYQEIFSPEGLQDVDPQDLKDFANSRIGAYPGNMSVFHDAWNALGPIEARRRVRGAVEYLLYGPTTSPLEDRLTHLIDPRRGMSMNGFREALLTKVLCVTYPDRFVPILKYTGLAGKREIVGQVYGIELPKPESVSWTIGRLILWSNDLLLDLVGDDFKDMQHAAAFLWWAKDRSKLQAARSS